jgi:transcriptional regulator with XRE-family HTH domain
MNEPSPHKVGPFIKFLRLGKNLTQQKLAAHLDVAVSSVSNWESGNALPRENWDKLAAYFGVSVDDLMTGGETEGVVSEGQLRELFSEEELQRLTDRQRRGLAMLLEECSIEPARAKVAIELLVPRK